ncbi:hypothetical protein IE53DRAFT_171837 [Violaceomyces palustris]|uniref:Uncharacterized protein n=1 Tax=Violaceomyces palustris TaxID=1673888 RepID=A0ACD0NT00_9BASI|nr:hypothetical protein IE53DRAFT_171837 [Violaceomyces palustris]
MARAGSSAMGWVGTPGPAQIEQSDHDKIGILTISGNRMRSRISSAFGVTKVAPQPAVPLMASSFLPSPLLLVLRPLPPSRFFSPCSLPAKIFSQPPPSFPWSAWPFSLEGLLLWSSARKPEKTGEDCDSLGGAGGIFWIQTHQDSREMLDRIKMGFRMRSFESLFFYFAFGVSPRSFTLYLLLLPFLRW